MSKRVILLLLAMLAVASCYSFRRLSDNQESSEESEDDASQSDSKFNLDSLVAFRQDIHQNPEPGFQEFRTQKKIIKYLKKLGVKSS